MIWLKPNSNRHILPFVLKGFLNIIKIQYNYSNSPDRSGILFFAFSAKKKI
jgi:hypothetical protein